MTEPPETGQPRFTPRPEAPGYPDTRGRRDDRGAAGLPAAASPRRRPHPPASAPPGSRPSPSFTPRPSGGEDRSGASGAAARAATAHVHAARGGTYRPRTGRARRRRRPRSCRRSPAGYPQPSFQPFDYEDAAPPTAPRFVPVDRGAGGPGAPPAAGGQPDPDPGHGGRPRPRRPGHSGPAATTGPNLARSSKAMALGTIASPGHRVPAHVRVRLRAGRRHHG